MEPHKDTFPPSKDHCISQQSSSPQNTAFINEGRTSTHLIGSLKTNSNSCITATERNYMPSLGWTTANQLLPSRRNVVTYSSTIRNALMRNHTPRGLNPNASCGSSACVKPGRNQPPRVISDLRKNSFCHCLYHLSEEI